MARPPAFQDHFSRDPVAYATFRPRYPGTLFDWLAGLPASRRLAWDCATGNGQAATRLAAHFHQVVGTDASRAQLGAAARAPRVGYVASLAESSALRSSRVDLIAVAQALHWIDLPRFSAEVRRVAAPGAALAAWGYSRLRVSSAIDPLIDRFHDETVGPFWPAERRLVEQGYRELALPIEEMDAPPFAIEAELSLPDLLGYLRTWSAVGKYLSVNHQDPVEALAPELAARWGPATAQRVTWPLFVRAGRLR